MGRNNLKSKYQSLKIITTLSIIVLSISFYPLLRKAIKKI
jgi:hypothetical protein